MSCAKPSALGQKGNPSQHHALVEQKRNYFIPGGTIQIQPVICSRRPPVQKGRVSRAPIGLNYLTRILTNVCVYWYPSNQRKSRQFRNTPFIWQYDLHSNQNKKYLYIFIYFIYSGSKQDTDLKHIKSQKLNSVYQIFTRRALNTIHYISIAVLLLYVFLLN